MSNINYVNSIMHEVNAMTDTIYESLVDNDTKELKGSIQRLIKMLKDIEKSHESE